MIYRHPTNALRFPSKASRSAEYSRQLAKLDEDVRLKCPQMEEIATEEFELQVIRFQQEPDLLNKLALPEIGLALGTILGDDVGPMTNPELAQYALQWINSKLEAQQRQDSPLKKQHREYKHKKQVRKLAKAILDNHPLTLGQLVECFPSLKELQEDPQVEQHEERKEA